MSARRKTAEETVAEMAGLLRADPSVTRREAADRLHLSYGYVCKRWKAACEAAGVEDVDLNARQRGTRKGGADLAGRRFGHLTVVEDMGTDGNGKRWWRCVCDCGGEAVRSTHALTSGQSTQCDRWDHDLLGGTFGRLTVIGFAGYTDRNAALFRCRCECGNETVVVGSDLRRGKVRSCGCLRASEDYVDGTRLSGLDADLRSDSPSGVTGVVPSRGRWRAQITLAGTVYYLGEHRSFERAVAVRREAEELMFDPVLEAHGRAPTDVEAWRRQVARALRERYRTPDDGDGDD